MAAKYTIQKRETAKDVARRFTGDPNRDVDMMPLNPHLNTITGQMGRPEFDPADWHDDLTVSIPDEWSERGQVSGPPSRAFSTFFRTQALSGSVGQSEADMEAVLDDIDGSIPGSGCGYAPRGNGKVKPYMIDFPNNEGLLTFTQKWLGKDDVIGRGLYTWSELAAVNPDKTKKVGNDCWLKNNVSLIRIPDDWPACPSMWSDLRRNSNGTPYTNVEPPAPQPPGGNGGSGSNGDIERVDATEDEEGGLVWYVLAAAAAVGGGILLYNSKKKKR